MHISDGVHFNHMV